MFRGKGLEWKQTFKWTKAVRITRKFAFYVLPILLSGKWSTWNLTESGVWAAVSVSQSARYRKWQVQKLKGHQVIGVWKSSQVFIETSERPNTYIDSKTQQTSWSDTVQWKWSPNNGEFTPLEDQNFHSIYNFSTIMSLSDVVRNYMVQ